MQNLKALVTCQKHVTQLQKLANLSQTRRKNHIEIMDRFNAFT